MIHHGDTETRRNWHRTQLPLQVLLILWALALSGWAQRLAQRSQPIELRELVDGGTKEANRLVIAQGCLVKEFEIVVLQPCGVRFDQFSKYSVWLDDIEEVTRDGNQAKRNSFVPAQSPEVLKNGRGNLWKVGGRRDHPHEVIVEGEFQISSRRRFGHLNFYKSRFIVHRYLEASDTK